MIVDRGCLYLMLSLLLLIAAYPLLERGPIGRALMLLLHSATLIVGVYVVSINKRHLFSGGCYLRAAVHLCLCVLDTGLAGG